MAGTPPGRSRNHPGRQNAKVSPDGRASIPGSEPSVFLKNKKGIRVFNKMSLRLPTGFRRLDDGRHLLSPFFPSGIPYFVIDTHPVAGYAPSTRGSMPTFTFAYTYAYRLFTGGGQVVGRALS